MIPVASASARIGQESDRYTKVYREMDKQYVGLPFEDQHDDLSDDEGDVVRMDDDGMSVGDVDEEALHCEQCPYDAPLEMQSCWQSTRSHVHLTMEDPDYNRMAKIISLTIMILIFVSTVAFVLETVIVLRDIEFWFILETFVVVVFSMEFVLRLASCRSIPKFVRSFLNIIDLLAVIPYYFDLFVDAGTTETLKVFRVVRLARIFRLFKMSRYSSYMQIMGKALLKSTDAFGLLLFFIFIAVVIFSSLVYYAERGMLDESIGRYVLDDGSLSPFSSIPASFYWCIVTMTTVGYGDLTPVTTAGKLIGSMTMILGILVIALPITILGSNFQDVYSVHKKSKLKGRTSATGSRLNDHVSAIRRHRVGLDKTLNQLRYLLQKRAGDLDFYQVWTTVDHTVLIGLLRIEQFLSNYESSSVGAAPMAAMETSMAGVVDSLGRAGSVVGSKSSSSGGGMPGAKYAAQ